MTRENSSFKFRTLLANCCRRQAALFTLSFVSMIAVLPVYIILNIQGSLRFYDNTNPEARNDLIQTIRNALLQNQLVNLALIVLAVIAGIAVFRYLHTRNQTDFFHALPITRRQIFAVRLTTGLLAVIPAYLINVAIACGVCAAYGYADAIDAKLLAYSILAHLIGFLLIYAVSVLAAILCGHTLVAILVCGWLQFGAFVGWLMVDYLLYVFYPARYTGQVNFPLWLSPPMELFQTTTELSYWSTIDEVNYLTQCILPSLACFVAAIVIFALCYVLHRKRKSENTGLSIAFPIIELPFKLYMISVAGIACGLIFEMITFNWTVMFFGMALGAFVTACVVEIVYDLDFHSLFRRWKSLLVYGAVCVVVLGCMAMDITHWNSTLPDREDIVSADLKSDVGAWDCGASDELTSSVYYGLWGFLLPAKTEQTGDTVEQFQSEEVIDAIYDSAVLGAQLMEGDRSSITVSAAGWSNNSFDVIFTLKNGKTFCRTYYAPYDTEQLEENGIKVRLSEEYLQTRTNIVLAEAKKDEITFMMAGGYEAIDSYSAGQVPTSAIPSILEILKEESMTLTADYLSEHVPVAMMRVATRDAQESYGDSTEIYLKQWDNMVGVEGVYDIPIYECETQTIAKLQQYIEGFTLGFGDITNIQNITIVPYEESDEEVQTYTEQEDIAAWSIRLVPQSFLEIMDPAYQTYNYDVIVTLKDGQSIDCIQFVQEDTE